MSLQYISTFSATDNNNWLTEQRLKSWQQFEQAAYPTRENELWRFSKLKQAELFAAELEKTNQYCQLDESIQIDNTDETYQCLIKLVNGNWRISQQNLPTGIHVLPLAEACQQFADLIKPALTDKLVSLGSDKFEYLHTATVSHGFCVIAEAGAVCDKAIYLEYQYDDAKLLHSPYTAIIAQENSKVNVIEKLTSTQAVKILAKTYLCCEKQAEIKHLLLQDLHPDAELIRFQQNQSYQHSDLRSLHVHTGAKWMRSENNGDLNEPEANIRLLSVAIPNSGQHYDQRTYQSHKAPNTYSNLLYKNSLYGKSNSIFSGIIHVLEGSHFTDAYQTCSNLLMDNLAEANSIPGLQINANDVKCSHGTTSSAIAEEELVYFLSRGIRREQAKEIIVSGFHQHAINTIENEQLAQLACQLMVNKFIKLRS